MYVRSKGVADTAKGELLTTLGIVLELKPASFASDPTNVNAFNSEWLLRETDALVRNPATATALRAGALAGLCSALSTCQVRQNCSIEQILSIMGCDTGYQWRP